MTQHSQAKSKPVSPVDEWRLFDGSPRLNAVRVAMQSHNAATHAWSLNHMGKHSSPFLEEAYFFLAGCQWIIFVCMYACTYVYIYILYDILYYIILSYIILYYIILYYSILYYILLYFIIYYILYIIYYILYIIYYILFIIYYILYIIYYILNIIY